MEVGGFAIRPGMYDEMIVKEASTVYSPLGIREGDIVFDIGAHIGVFSRYAVSQGAKEVWAYEPEPENYALLIRNTGAYENIFPHQKAVVAGHHIDSVSLFLNKGTNTGSHSQYIQRGRGNPIEVPAVSFSRIVSEDHPTVVKIDTEGAEYDILMAGFDFDSIRTLAVELHLNKKHWRHTMAPELVNRIESFMGFKPIRKPYIGEKNWHTVGIWSK